MAQTIGPYRILGSLGRGGMGVVYRAQHEAGGEWVALKTVLVPDHSLLQGIRREIQALARIRHPGIVRIVDEGLHEGLPWYAMELLEGIELREYCALHAQLEMSPHRDRSSTPGREPRSGLLRPVPQDGDLKLWTLSLAPSGESTPKAPEARLSTPKTPFPGAATPQLPVGGTTPRAGEANGREAGPDTTPQAPAIEVEPMAPPAFWEEASATQGAARNGKPLAAGGVLPLVLTILRRLCSTLAFLHGEGIVHRDLKPSNVLVQPDGTAVLMDFGLVSHFGGEISREALDVGEVGVGTVGYMAPEQIRGELLDARADLYSLGCILFELVTGRQPFVRSTVAEVARAHLKAAPLPPSQFVDGVPPELDALALQLLAKRPQDRIGHADAVAAALRELGAEEDERLRSWPRPRPYLYRPGFAGRAEPLAELQQRLDGLYAKHGGMVLVGGESGVGKTRLAMEIAHKAVTHKSLVLAGECLDVGGRPMEALRRPLQAIADRCRSQGRAEADRLLGPRGKVLALYELALGGLPGQERYPEPAELRGPAAVARLQSYMAETLETLASNEPVLLVLDDLQWADELVLGVLEFLARGGRLDQMPLLVLGTYRTEEVGPGLERLLQLEDCGHLNLGRLKEDAVASMVGDMLGLTPPPQLFSQFLARHSEGNPFFVAEYLRTAVAESLLWRDGQGRWRIAEDRYADATTELYESLPLPGSLRELVGRRLRGLPDEARKVAEAVAVLGREVELEMVRQLCNLEEKALLEATGELLRRQVLEEIDASRLRFVHDKIREVAYSGMDEARCSQLHGLAARALRSVVGESGEPAASIARHFDAAGETAEARAAYERAAEDAGRRYANEEALRLYRRAEALWQDQQSPDACRTRAALALGQARVRRRLGRYAEAEQDLERAAELAGSLGDKRQQALAMVERAEIAWRRSSPHETARLADEAEALGRTLADPALQGAAARHRAIAWFHSGQKLEAIAEMERARELARQSKDASLELQVTENLASLFSSAQRPSMAIPLLEDLIPRHRQAAARDRLCTALIMLGQARSGQGDFSGALLCLREGLEEARAISSPDSEMRVLGSLANCYDDLYQVYRALDAATRASRLAQDLGDHRSLAFALQLRCRQLRHLGDQSAAQALLPRAIEAAEAARAPFIKVFVALEEAHLAAAAGRKEKVREAADAALGMLLPDDEVGTGRGYAVRVSLARATLNVNALDLTERLVQAMRLQVLAQAARSPDDMNWLCVVLPELMLELHAHTSGSPVELIPARLPSSVPQESWGLANWLGWGTRELDRLLRQLQTEFQATFLSHPGYQLQKLFDAARPGRS
jgi:tetratricopeptide (TPR) repeat protein